MCRNAGALSTIASDLYEVIDIGPHAYAPLGWSGASPGINIHHDIAWTTLTEGASRAMLTLRCARLGLPAAEPIDLSALAAYPGHGSATDINDAGVVVGSQRAMGPDQVAHIWDLPNRGLGQWAIPLPTLASDGQGSGIALGLSEGPSPLVVGEAETDFLPLPTWAYAFGAFSCQYESASGVPTLHDLGGYGRFGDPQKPDPFESVACDVDAANSIIGHRSICQSLGVPVRESYALLWEWSGGWSMEQLPAGSCSLTGDRALGLNDAGWCVGQIAATLDLNGDGIEDDCELHAAAWEYSGTSPVDLAAVEAVGQPDIVGANSAANAASNPADGVTVVVGMTYQAQHAIRWVHDEAGVWSVRRLNDLASPLYGWEFLEATDVSDDGWIVGYGRHGGERRVFLLKPIACPGDVNGDGVTKGDDLALLYSSWGLANASVARLDLDLDSVIGAGDLAALLGDWGSECPLEQCPAPPISVESETRERCEEAALCALQMTGFHDCEAFAQWRASTPAGDRIAIEECVACCFIARMAGE